MSQYSKQNILSFKNKLFMETEKKMKKISLTQIITILATIITITINGLANALPLNGLTTGEISDRFDIYFVPAGYVFSIWGLIYLGLIVYTIFQAMPKQRDNEILKKIAPIYWVSSLANSAWIFMWHFERFTITLPFMLAILISLLLIYLRLSSVTGSLKWLVKLPFSIYLGWITVATVANISQFLFFANWGGWGISGATWAVIMLGIASLLGLIMAWRENDTPYLLVLIWAFIGITISQADSQLVVYGAWTAVAVLAAGLLGSIVKHRRVY
jgi:hypothetical protein